MARSWGRKRNHSRDKPHQSTTRPRVGFARASIADSLAASGCRVQTGGLDENRLAASGEGTVPCARMDPARRRALGPLRRNSRGLYVVEGLLVLVFVLSVASDPSSPTLMIGGGLALFFFAAWAASKLYLRSDRGRAALAEYEARRQQRR